MDDAEQSFLEAYRQYKDLVRKEPHLYSRYLKITSENIKLFYNQNKQPEKALRITQDTLNLIQEISETIDNKIQDIKDKIDSSKDAATRFPKKAEKKVGRNDPCPCGSGLKYKKCCWAKDFSKE